MIEFYTDIAHLKENDRITVIGKFVMSEPANGTEKPKVVGIALETKEKAERYQKKLLKKFPTIKILEIAPGLIPDTVLLRIAGPNYRMVPS